ncbi:MAG: hypothetical protein ACR2JC_02000 [Chloroflexota bacterium]
MRFGLLIVVLIACGAIVAAHGIRGVGFLLVLGLAAGLPRTRAWRMIEGPLVRLTGSRQRAAAVLMVVVVAVLAGVNLYAYVR